MVIKNRFNLSTAGSTSDKDDEALKGYYKSWRSFNQEAKLPFIILDNSFKDNYLKDLEPGPLKLYLYFCFHAKNESGESWHGIQGIADYFNAQTRTIDNWIKVLVEKDLIYRAQKRQKSHTTYLLPFGDTVITHPAPRKHDKDDQTLLDDFINKIQDLSFVYGEIVKVFHLFQWLGLKDKTSKELGNEQHLLIITKRQNGVLIGHIHTLRKSKNSTVNLPEIEEPATFTSPFFYNGSNIIGIASVATPRLLSKNAMQDLLNLVRQLASLEEWKIEDRQKLMFGENIKMLSIIEETADESEEIEETEEADEVSESKLPKKRRKRLKR